MTPVGFESSVNPEGIQTGAAYLNDSPRFESSVNPEGIQTIIGFRLNTIGFESSVNPEGIQTNFCTFSNRICLRVV